MDILPFLLAFLLVVVISLGCAAFAFHSTRSRNWRGLGLQGAILLGVLAFLAWRVMTATGSGGPQAPFAGAPEAMAAIILLAGPLAASLLGAIVALMPVAGAVLSVLYMSALAIYLVRFS